MLDDEDVVGLRLNRARDPLAVLFPEEQRAQDEQIERALEIALYSPSVRVRIDIDTSVAQRWVECQQECPGTPMGH